MSEREYYRETTRSTPDPSAPTARLSEDASRDVYHQREVVDDNARFVESAHVHEPSETARRAARAARLRQIVWFVAGLIITVIAIRFVLFLLGANLQSGFFQLIYALSQPFVLPFLGLFGEPTYGTSVLESASAVAIVIYTLVAYGISRLIGVTYEPTRPASR